MSICHKAVCTGIFLGLALSEPARADETGVLKAIKFLGASFTRDENLPSKPVVGVNLYKRLFGKKAHGIRPLS